MRRSYGEASTNLAFACEAAKMVGKRDHAILVVDDDPVFLGLVSRRLESVGRSCICVQTLDTARLYLQKCQASISAVIVDYFVGKECGMDFLSEVLKTRSLACFLVSADEGVIYKLHKDQPTLAALPKWETNRLFEMVGVAG